MDPALEAILLEILRTLTLLTDERTQRVARVKRLEDGVETLAGKATQLDRRLRSLERMVKN